MNKIFPVFLVLVTGAILIESSAAQQEDSYVAIWAECVANNRNTLNYRVYVNGEYQGVADHFNSHIESESFTVFKVKPGRQNTIRIEPDGPFIFDSGPQDTYSKEFTIYSLPGAVRMIVYYATTPGSSHVSNDQRWRSLDGFMDWATDAQKRVTLRF
jgi:hypothetical protein